MIHRTRSAWLVISLLVLFGTFSVPRSAQAGVADAALALAGPLAEQFGVPVSAVTGLLESGVSLDSVTQLLLITQSSDSKLGAVTDLYRGSGDSIAKTAESLNVAPAAYSQDRVTAALDEAKQGAQAAATENAVDGASSAVGSALKGLTGGD